MIGVVGGGQLAMLLIEAGKKRDVDVVVQTAAKTDPAAKKTNQVILYDPTNPAVSYTHLTLPTICSV